MIQYHRPPGLQESRSHVVFLPSFDLARPQVVSTPPPPPALDGALLRFCRTLDM